MSYSEIFGLLNFTLAGTFVLIAMTYGISGLNGMNADFNKYRGFTPFVLLTVYFAILGLFFICIGSLTKFLQDYKELLIFLNILLVLMAGLYLFRFKDARPVYYSIIEILYSCSAFTMTFLLKAKFVQNETWDTLMPLLWTLIGFLYVVVRGLENIDKNINEEKNPKLFPHWKLLRAYLLTDRK